LVVSLRTPDENIDIYTSVAIHHGGEALTPISGYTEDTLVQQATVEYLEKFVPFSYHT